jgi:prepilin-type N-terminal cleavage/methylation domain-containing protein
MRGFTLIEAMVALVLLSFTALALGQCLLTAQRAQQDSGRWMRAVALTEEALERARARAASGADVIERYQRRWSSADAGGGLRRIEAAVAWDGHEVRLASLVWGEA